MPNATGTITLGAGTLTGNLTVNTPNATFVNNANVGGTVFINNVSANTWNENASGNKLEFNDPNANTNLVIAAGKTVASLTLKTQAVVTIPASSTVTALTVASTATGATINNSGTVTTLSSDATGTTITGNGSITTINGSQKPLATVVFGSQTPSSFVLLDEMEFSVQAKLPDNYDATDKALRFKAVITKDGQPVNGLVIKYNEAPSNDYSNTFTTDSNGVAYFGPSVGLSNMAILALKNGGVETPFRVTLKESGNYNVTITLVDTLKDNAVVSEAEFLYVQ